MLGIFGFAMSRVTLIVLCMIRPSPKNMPYDPVSPIIREYSGLYAAHSRTLDMGVFSVFLLMKDMHEYTSTVHVLTLV